MAEKFDIFGMVTDRIIEELEHGVVPWRKPWIATSIGVVADPRRVAVSHATGKVYGLANQILLRKPGEYVTYEECHKEGGRIKKGEKASVVVFWKVIVVDEKDVDGKPILKPDGTHKKKSVPLLRYSNVFRLDQTEGLKPRVDVSKIAAPAASDHGAKEIKAADDVIEGYVGRSGVKFFSEESNRAYYSPAFDEVHVPCIGQYKDAVEYYSTAFHELTHSTGNKSRLGRFDPLAGAAAFGSESYSKEELVAEIGAAACLNTLGIETDGSFKNSAAYIDNWLHALRNDKRLIVSAAGCAQKAIDMIFGMDQAGEGVGVE